MHERADRLTPNFLRSEFACKGGHDCCDGTAAVSMNLVLALQKLRDRVDGPLHILSGFRCLKHNRRIGSKDTSQHVIGLAADVLPPANMTSIDLKYLALEIEAFNHGGIGLHKKWLHLDIRSGGPARWGYDD